MWAGLAALFLRQIGHAVLEPPCHDKEAVLLGYNTRNKTLILGAYLLIPAVYVAQASAWTAERSVAAGGAGGAGVVRCGRRWWSRDAWRISSAPRAARLAMVWFVKLITDPVTDLLAYSPRYLAAPKAMLASRGRNDGSR